MPTVVRKYIHKYETSLEYGGPEEGGWWYNRETPIETWSPLPVNCFEEDDYEAAYDLCRTFNEQEHRRRDGLSTKYHSVLAYRETFYSFDLSDSPIPEQSTRPHYE
jgi:hypothetical protein